MSKSSYLRKPRSRQLAEGFRLSGCQLGLFVAGDRFETAYSRYVI